MILAECSFREFVQSPFFEQFCSKDKFSRTLLKNEHNAIVFGVRHGKEQFDDLIGFYKVYGRVFQKVGECSDEQASEDLSVALVNESENLSGRFFIVISPILIGKKLAFKYVCNPVESRALEEGITGTGSDEEDYFPGLVKQALKPFTESYKDEDEEDEDVGAGWSETVQDMLSGLLDKVYDLSYEIRSCSRGVYTECLTRSSLAEYLKRIGDEFLEVAEDLN